jgi:hypothetical protein
LRFYSETRAYYARLGFALRIFYDLHRDHGVAELDVLLASRTVIYVRPGRTVALQSAGQALQVVNI